MLDYDGYKMCREAEWDADDHSQYDSESHQRAGKPDICELSISDTVAETLSIE